MSGHNVFINANFNGNGDHSMCEFTLQTKFFTKWLLHIIYWFTRLERLDRFARRSTQRCAKDEATRADKRGQHTLRGEDGKHRGGDVFEMS